MTFAEAVAQLAERLIGIPTRGVEEVTSDVPGSIGALYELANSGAITANEYEAKKVELLTRL